tara:strand:- start:19240 stop:20166 length:927 start_codon:yes stop_codon:yes gene_type:complete
MKSIFYYIIFYFFIINITSVSFSKIQNSIVLKVGNEIITNYEIKNKIVTTLIVANEQINQNKINNLKPKAIETLIQHKLKKIELSKYKLKTDQVRVDRYINNILGGEVEKFKNKLKINNLSYDLFREEIEIQFKWQALMFQIYSNKININEVSLENELNELLSKRSQIEEFNLSEIEILRDSNFDQKKILDIQKKIEEQGFDNVAFRYSISPTSNKNGNLGWINSDILSKEIFKIVNRMRINEISSPILRSDSILFLRLNEKRSSKTENINRSKFKENLFRQKTDEMFSLYSKSHLSKLKNNTLIEYK